MHWLGLIISLLIIGLIAGALARLLVPGRQDMSIGMTLVLGLIGSFVGGFLGYLLFHKDSQDGFLQPAGIIGSVIGAIIVAAAVDSFQRPKCGSILIASREPPRRRLCRHRVPIDLRLLRLTVADNSPRIAPDRRVVDVVELRRFVAGRHWRRPALARAHIDAEKSSRLGCAR